MSTVFATFWTMFWTQVLLKCTVDDAMQVHIDEAAFCAPATRVDVGMYSGYADCGYSMSIVKRKTFL